MPKLTDVVKRIVRISGVSMRELNLGMPKSSAESDRDQGQMPCSYGLSRKVVKFDTVKSIV